MARTHVVKFEDGFAVELREFLVEDENLLASRKARKRGEVGTNLLAALTVNLVDPGPYTEEMLSGATRLDAETRKEVPTPVCWRTVLHGHRHAVLVKNRVLTWGGEYEVTEPCPTRQTRMCNGKGRLLVDLGKLPIVPLPESSFSHVRSETPLSCVLPISKKKVEFRLLTGKDEKSLAKLAKDKQDALSSASLRLRTISIEDVKRPDLERWLLKASSGDASFLRKAFEEADCGVLQDKEFECDECGKEWTQEVELSEDFLFPRYRGSTTPAASAP